MNNKNSYVLFFSALILSQSIYAGGPSTLEGPTGNTPVRYQNPNITIKVENGTLGEFSNTQANALVSAAFQLWNNINTSTLNLSLDTTTINEDINIDNYLSYLDNSEDLNLLIYDDTGEIINDLYGEDQGDILGVAASSYYVAGKYFIEGYAIINGIHPSISNIEVVYTQLIAHEIAHFFGLDHSQVNIDNQESPDGFPRICSTAPADDYPLMYPYINCRDSVNPHSDDISAISALYPITNINNTLGIIEGRFVDESGKPILGANIWLKNLVSGETFSIVSDYLKQGTGYYKLYLPAGNYSLHADAINEVFYAGSSVGPYSTFTGDVSFIKPIAEVTYQDDSGSGDGVITVTTDQTITVNFSSSGSVAVIPETISSNNSGNDSIADMLGALSPSILLLFLLPLILGRRLLRVTDSL